MSTRLVAVILFGGLWAAAGCSGGGIVVEGKVVNDGNPVTFAEGEGLSINLTSEDGKASGTGMAEKDGTFKIKSAEGGGLPPGKYKVGYTHYLPTPPPPKPGPPPVTKTTKEVWDVSSSNKTFTLDIGKAK